VWCEGTGPICEDGTVGSLKKGIDKANIRETKKEKRKGGSRMEKRASAVLRCSVRRGKNGGARYKKKTSKRNFLTWVAGTGRGRVGGQRKTLGRVSGERCV